MQIQGAACQRLYEIGFRTYPGHQGEEAPDRGNPSEPSIRVARDGREGRPS